jgi:hypothetical protein
MKYTRQVTLLGSVMFLLITAVVLPVSAQEGQAPTVLVTYTFNEHELQRLEDGVIVQTWTMPNSLETWQTLAVLQADGQRQPNTPEVYYRFDQDRMYHLQGNQVIDVWLLRGGQWIAAPRLDVQYVFTGSELRRFVNGNLQQAWSMTRTRETQQVMLALQAETDKIASARAGHTSNN